MPFSSVLVQYFLKPKLRAASLPHFTCPTKSWSSAETANPRLRNLYAGTQSWNLLKGFAFFCSASSSSSLSSSSSVVLRRSRNADSKLPPRLFGRGKLALGRVASDEYGSVDSDGEAQSLSNQLVNFARICWFKLSISVFSLLIPCCVFRYSPFLGKNEYNCLELEEVFKWEVRILLCRELLKKIFWICVHSEYVLNMCALYM